ncbi:MAG: hypothetical protein ACLVES_06385 [Faecalibacterium prausnitzii]
MRDSKSNSKAADFLRHKVYNEQRHYPQKIQRFQRERDTPSSTLYFCIAVSVRSLFPVSISFEGSVGTGQLCCCSPHFPSAAARSLPVAPTLFPHQHQPVEKARPAFVPRRQILFYYIARFFILFFQLFTKLPEIIVHLFFCSGKALSIVSYEFSLPFSSPCIIFFAVSISC